MLERLTSDKHSNLLGQFLSYEKNEALWIRTQIPNFNFLFLNSLGIESSNIGYLLVLSNCDVGYFIFHHCFHIMSPKFLKFKRVQNIAEKFQKLWKWKCEI
jgi:hypothetical protein